MRLVPPSFLLATVSLLAGSHVAAGAEAGPAKIKLVTREASLGKVPPMALITSFATSADNRHIAYPVTRGTEVTVSLDGVAGARFTKVADLVFSPDGKHLAYAGRRDDKWRAVVDGREGPEYEDIGRNGLASAPTAGAWPTWRGGATNGWW